AFGSCSGFSGTLKLPENLESLSDSAFYGCGGFTGELVIPDKVTYIPREVFARMTGITALTVGRGVTSVHTYASDELPFYGMTGVETVSFL
ncbi:leucine-rich repeat protein, partial [Blautia glucerasea]|uniref:leucine-rich repeat protein n=1 Tax=Blautia glucerasea TaxID=536633 RepID=UPI001D06C010